MKKTRYKSGDTQKRSGPTNEKIAKDIAVHQKNRDPFLKKARDIATLEKAFGSMNNGQMMWSLQY